MSNIDAFSRLCAQLAKLPGVGRKSAQRPVVVRAVHVAQNEGVGHGNRHRTKTVQNGAQTAVVAGIEHGIPHGRRKKGRVSGRSPVTGNERRIVGDFRGFGGLEKRAYRHAPDEGNVHGMHEHMGAVLRKCGHARAYAGEHAALGMPVDGECGAEFFGLPPGGIRPAAAYDDGTNAFGLIERTHGGKGAAFAVRQRQREERLEMGLHAGGKARSQNEGVNCHDNLQVKV